MRALLPLAFAVCLVGCATGTPRMIAEKAMIDADLTYVAIAEVSGDYETVAGANIAKAEAIKLKAWKALIVIRHAYAIGAAFDASPLTALLADAKALGH